MLMIIIAGVFGVAGVASLGLAAFAGTAEQGASSSPPPQGEYPPIEWVVQNQPSEEQAISLEESLAEAESIVVGKVVTIDDPRWNSRDGSDWREKFDPLANNFTIPMPFTSVNVQIEAVLGGNTKVAVGDTLGVVFRNDPSLDVLSVEDQKSIASPGVAARFVSPGDTRIFVLTRSPFPYSDGFGEVTWRASVLNGLWGISSDGESGLPGG